jgi:hypothetical protein
MMMFVRTRAHARRFAAVPGARLRLFTVLAVLPFAALAQGGPPLVTDDPETPGDGKWEINVASIVSRTSARHEVLVPDVDANYGWGAYVQLKLDLPWAFAREGGGPWRSGIGNTDLGVKWRFIDAEDAGFSMATYPQYSAGWVGASRRRGVASDQRQFLAPLEFSTRAGSFAFDGEVGRNFVHGGKSEWVAGGILAHACGAGRQCLLEVRETRSQAGTRSLWNLGLHWNLSGSLVLLAAAGRETGPQQAEPQRMLVYFGVQLLR